MSPSRLPRASRVALVTALIAGLLLLAGCVSWRTVSRPVNEQLFVRRPARARLILSDWSTVIVRHPHVSGDTLWGCGPGGGPPPSPHRAGCRGDRVGYPVEQVRAVQLDHTEVGASILTVLGFGSLSLLALGGLATALDQD